MPEQTSRPIKRALISVSDKSGLEDLGQCLSDYGVEIISTGGTAAILSKSGVSVKEVSAYTEFPEIMDGRIKTLHPLIHGGILARRDDKAHIAAMKQHGITPIDLVVINLYPFEAAVAGGANFDACIENIDIGGPSLIRAAAKNHEYVTVVTDPSDYSILMNTMRENEGVIPTKLRKQLGAAAYARTGAYDAAISTWFAEKTSDALPKQYNMSGTRVQLMRYGENPHQAAAFYKTSDKRPGVATANQLQGKELSFNNLNDTDAAFELVAEFGQPAVAIIKHANPCGVAVGDTLELAYDKALRCDPVSAFGGILAVNRPLDGATAEAIKDLFLEVVIAPEVDTNAQIIFENKKNLRVIITGSMPDANAPGTIVKALSGGFLLQNRDSARVTANDLTCVTKRKPTEHELQDLLFAFSVCKHVKSNAIVYAKDGATVGIGAGQMSRVDSCRIAAQKSAEAAEAAEEPEPLTKGSVVASDAFFPFADGLLTAANAGATAVIQPGGSIRDDEVIAAANEQGLAMVFTGIRHFRH